MLRGLVARYHVVALTVLATVLMWPSSGFGPTPGLDPGWTTGLALARQQGLHFGSQVVFNYGPLGFALFPTVFARRTLVVCVVVIAVLCGMYAVLTYRLLRSRFTHRYAIVAATLVLIALAPSTGSAYCDVVAIVVLITMVDLARRPAAPHPLWPTIFGATITLLLLTKVSTGLVVATAFVVFALAHAGRTRRLVVGGVVAALSFVVLWLALGQRISDIWIWLRGVQQISTGHSWAMAAEEAGRGWETAVAAALGTVLVLAGVAIVRRRLADGGGLHVTDAGAAVLVALTFYFAFKEGFVRHDIHSGIFFFAVMYALATLTPWSRLGGDIGASRLGGDIGASRLGGDIGASRLGGDIGASRLGGSAQVTMAMCWVVSLLALNASGSISLATALDTQPSATSFASTVNVLVDVDGWRDQQFSVRAALLTTYAVPDDLLAELRGHRVHVDPYDPAPIWAYGLAWDPPPVFTRYSAYTVQLDRRVADDLDATNGPDRVLRSAARTLDGHFPLLEAPQSAMALLCDFRQLTATAEWQVLGRAPDRCGALQQVSSLDVEAREDIAAPTIDPSRQALLVQIDFHLGPADSIRTLLYKAHEYHLDVDGTRFRITPLVATQPGPLFLPADAGWDGPFQPLAAPPAVLHIDHPATVTFFTVDVTASPST